jgi:peroxiredoxin
MMRFLFFILLCSPFGAVAQEIAGGQEAPAFEITLLDDTIVNSRAFEGQVVFLAFVRTVLPANPAIACARSIGVLSLIDKELISRFREEEDLVILPIVMHYRSKQEVVNFKNRYRFNFPMGVDENKKVASRFISDGAIHLFVIDREGKVTEVPDTRESTAEEREAYKASTGKRLPLSRISLEPAVTKIEEALAVVPRGGIDFQPLSLAGALERARAEGKLVLVNCYLPWYASSQHLLKKVFTRKSVGNYCNARFVCVKFDMEEEEGKRLQKRFDLPLTELTTLVLDPNGKVIYRMSSGSGTSADEWLAGIANSVEP